MKLLSGIRVLDLSRVMSGPYCTALLGDLGAEVIKIETPGSGDDARRFGPFVGGESVYFALLNRNKKSVTLNLKAARARAIMAELAAKCDVVVENFRPGVAARLEVDAARLRERNPRLVYLSISGFGQTGPLAAWPAYDLIVQAMSGLMSLTGSPDGPPTAVGESIADVATGLFGAWAVLAALWHRERTGEGQTIDLAMLDAMLSMQLTGLARYAADREAPQRVGNRHPVTTPVDVFRARDGHVAIVVPSDAQFRELCAILGQPALAADERYANNAARRANESALRELIESWTASRRVEEVIHACHARAIPAGPVRDLAQAWRSRPGPAIGHPAFGQLELALQPAKFSGQKAAAVREPALGEHTSAVLEELLGLGQAEVEALRAEGVI
ncbi:MAG TPA: CoA transferase [Burkholderiales bacterium]|jgi:CoA:oxalate CoA-transferase